MSHDLRGARTLLPGNNHDRHGGTSGSHIRNEERTPRSESSRRDDFHAANSYGESVVLTTDWRAEKRDPEVAEVLESITMQLRHVERLYGPERDAAYARVEAFAAPYAIALYYEIAMLGSVICHKAG
jgi:hypothetical protein